MCMDTQTPNRSLMFVVQEAVSKNNAKSEDTNGKRFISMLIIVANAAAGGLYPLYRIFNAWAENGEFDMDFVKGRMSNCLGCFMGTKLAGYLMSTCRCLAAFKDNADKAKEEVAELHAKAQSYIEEVRKAEIVCTTGQHYNDVMSVKEQVHQGRALAAEVKDSILNVQDAANELRREATISRYQTTDNQVLETESGGMAGQTDASIAARGFDDEPLGIYANPIYSLGQPSFPSQNANAPVRGYFAFWEHPEIFQGGREREKERKRERERDEREREIASERERREIVEGRIWGHGRQI